MSSSDECRVPCGPVHWSVVDLKQLISTIGTCRVGLRTLLKKCIWLDMVVCDQHLSSWETVVGGSGGQGPPWLYDDFEANLGYMTLIGFKRRKEKNRYTNYTSK